MGFKALTAVTEELADPRAAGDAVAQAILDGLTLEANSVAILLASIEIDLAPLAEVIRAKLGIPLIGCTTYSEATGGGGYTEDSVTLLVLTSDTAELALGLAEGLTARGADAVGAAWDQAAAKLTTPPRLAIAFPDAALVAKGEVVVEALASRGAGHGGLAIMGACPGDGGAFKRTFQVVDDRVVSDAVALLLVGGSDVEPVVVTRTGWEPMGVKGIATKVDGTKLLEVDGKPAVEYVGRYVSDLDSPEIIGTFPIALFETDAAEDDQRRVLRSPFFTDKATGGVVYGGTIPQGCTIQMGRAYRERVLESATAAATHALARRGGRPPACVFFASCGARKLVLGAATHKEVDALRAVFGEAVPIAGLYSYGEIGPFDSTDTIDRPRYHNCTLVLCAL